MSEPIMQGSSDHWNKMDPKFRTRLLSELTRLKAEVASLKSLCDNLGMGGKHTVTAIVEEYEKLKAEVERLRKAGDKLVEVIQEMDVIIDMDSDHPEVKAWNAAKEGKQP